MPADSQRYKKPRASVLFRAVIRGVHRHTLDANIYKNRDIIPTFEEKKYTFLKPATQSLE